MDLLSVGREEATMSTANPLLAKIGCEQPVRVRFTGRMAANDT